MFEGEKFLLVTKKDIVITEGEIIFKSTKKKLTKIQLLALFDVIGACPLGCKRRYCNGKEFEKCFGFSLKEARKLLLVVPKIKKEYEEYLKRFL